MSLLEIRGLTVAYPGKHGDVLAVDGVDFSIGKGEFVGLAGESGCGKTTMAMAIPNLLPRNARITAGSVVFDGADLTTMDEDGLRTVRWNEISVVFQGALNALNPVHTVGSQILEPIRVHDRGTSEAEARSRMEELLEAVGIPAGRAGDFPHQFSGGMRQRVMIAMALACRPQLVIADEPITALDVMTQAQILDLLRSLCDRYGLSMLLISHDLSVLAQTCDRVAVMYAGRIVETGPAGRVFGSDEHHGGARHPYTQRLLRAYPNIRRERVFIEGIPGYPPDLTQPQSGCRFRARCDLAIDKCAEEPTLVDVGGDHRAACWRLDQAVTS
ncbi:MAG: ABC transporter ATP-binding protein [Actinobacteria bacterium]|nr:ABC transporter ATP-binding protein [Actinomycetota bacterium]